MTSARLSPTFLLTRYDLLSMDSKDISDDEKVVGSEIIDVDEKISELYESKGYEEIIDPERKYLDPIEVQEHKKFVTFSLSQTKHYKLKDITEDQFISATENITDLEDEDMRLINALFERVNYHYEKSKIEIDLSTINKMACWRNIIGEENSGITRSTNLRTIFRIIKIYEKQSKFINAGVKITARLFSRFYEDAKRINDNFNKQKDNEYFDINLTKNRNKNKDNITYNVIELIKVADRFELCKYIHRCKDDRCLPDPSVTNIILNKPPLKNTEMQDELRKTTICQRLSARTIMKRLYVFMPRLMIGLAAAAAAIKYSGILDTPTETKLAHIVDDKLLMPCDGQVTNATSIADGTFAVECKDPFPLLVFTLVTLGIGGFYGFFALIDKFVYESKFIDNKYTIPTVQPLMPKDSIHDTETKVRKFNKTNYGKMMR